MNEDKIRDQQLEIYLDGLSVDKNMEIKAIEGKADDIIRTIASNVMLNWEELDDVDWEIRMSEMSEGCLKEAIEAQLKHIFRGYL